MNQRLAQYIVPAFVVVIIMLMVFPIWARMLDLLLVANIALALLVVFIAGSVRRPSDFSVFPAMLLMLTLGRLSLNVASTRMILTEGKDFGGIVVKAFGQWAIGGNYVVGMIIFLIVVLIQFLVVTRGAERVAEVAARFRLDALPMKQMGIENQLSSRFIDEEAAALARAEIQEEMDFYGAMDGASRFIKGETMVSVLIVALNMLGGLYTGFAKGGFTSVAELFRTYALLTVGDGLVGLFPSLFVSVAAGIIITRSNSSDGLGQDVASQLGRRNDLLVQSLVVISGLLAVFGVFSGVARGTFLVLAVLTGAGAWWLQETGMKKTDGNRESDGAGSAPNGQGRIRGMSLSSVVEGGGTHGTRSGRRAGTAAPTEEDTRAVAELEAEDLPLGSVHQVELLLDAETCLRWREDGTLARLDAALAGVRTRIYDEWGLPLAPVRFSRSVDSKPGEYSVRLRGEEVFSGRLREGCYLAVDDSGGRCPVEGALTRAPGDCGKAKWIDPAVEQEALELGLEVLRPEQVMTRQLYFAVTAHGAELFGLQELEDLRSGVARMQPAVIKALTESGLDDVLMLAVFRNLLEEDVSVRNAARIFEAMVQGARGTRDPEQLVDFVRYELRRQICRRLADEHGVINCFTLSPEVEDELRSSLFKADDGVPSFALEPEKGMWLLGEIKEAAAQLRRRGGRPVALVPAGMRREFFRFCRGYVPKLVVLSFPELHESFSHRPVAVVESPGAEEGDDLCCGDAVTGDTPEPSSAGGDHDLPV